MSDGFGPELGVTLRSRYTYVGWILDSVTTTEGAHLTLRTPMSDGFSPQSRHLGTLRGDPPLSPPSALSARSARDVEQG